MPGSWGKPSQRGFLRLRFVSRKFCRVVKPSGHTYPPQTQVSDESLCTAQNTTSGSMMVDGRKKRKAPSVAEARAKKRVSTKIGRLIHIPDDANCVPQAQTFSDSSISWMTSIRGRSWGRGLRFDLWRVCSAMLSDASSFYTYSNHFRYALRPHRDFSLWQVMP